MFGGWVYLEPFSQLHLELVAGRELNFHVWNTNSHSFGLAENEAQMFQDGRPWKKFCTSSSWSCTSVPVPRTTLIFSHRRFRWFSFKSIHNHEKEWSDEISLDQFYINKYLKVFIIAVCPKKCGKLSKGGKQTVKSERTFRSFLRSFFWIVLWGFSLIW